MVQRLTDEARGLDEGIRQGGLAEDKAMMSLERDPWKHRSKGMLCATCMFYVPKVSSAETGHASIGRCRRHAPTMNGYPAVFPNDWCGDHKLDEGKLT